MEVVSARCGYYRNRYAENSSHHSASLTQPGSEFIRPKHLTPAQFRLTWRALTDWRHYRYFSFCFVRDPWERFGSLHRYLLSRPRYAWVPPDLNDFVAELGGRAPRVMNIRSSIRPQSDYARHVLFVGKFERLADDFAKVAERLGFEPAALDRMNASGAAVHYQTQMNARSEAIIAEVYRDDIARYGYQ